MAGADTGKLKLTTAFAPVYLRHHNSPLQDDLEFFETVGIDAELSFTYYTWRDAFDQLEAMFDFGDAVDVAGPTSTPAAEWLPEVPSSLPKLLPHVIHVLWWDGSRTPEKRALSLPRGIACKDVEALLDYGAPLMFGVAVAEEDRRNVDCPLRYLDYSLTHLSRGDQPMPDTLEDGLSQLVAYVCPRDVEHMVQVPNRRNMLPPALLPKGWTTTMLHNFLRPFRISAGHDVSATNGTYSVMLGAHYPYDGSSLWQEDGMDNMEILDAWKLGPAARATIEKQMALARGRSTWTAFVKETVARGQAERFGVSVTYEARTATLSLRHGEVRRPGPRIECPVKAANAMHLIQMDMLKKRMRVRSGLFWNRVSEVPIEKLYRGIVTHCPPPPSLAACPPLPKISVPLFEHQLQSLAFMLERERHAMSHFVGAVDAASSKRGGVLADAMGLGKTLTTLALVAAQPAPTLIVCTSSLMGQWQREISDKTSLTYKVFHGRNRQHVPEGADLVLTTYGMLRVPEIRGHEWYRVVFDESHTMSDAIAQRYNPPLAEVVWCLSATPWKNWDRQVKALGFGCGPRELSWLLYRLAVRHAQHSHSAVMPRVEHVRVSRSLDMYEAHTYQDLLKSVRASFSPTGILAALMPLRRFLSSGIRVQPKKRKQREAPTEAPEDDICPVCMDVYQDPVMTQCTHWFCRDCWNQVKRHVSPRCPMCRQAVRSVLPAKGTTTTREHAEDVPKEPARAGSKALEVMARLADTKKGKALVFSEYGHTLANLHACLLQKGVASKIVLGHHTPWARNAAFEAFQKDAECRVLLLTMRAASAGVSLPAAETVIFMEPVLDASAHQQAIGRAVRHGNPSAAVRVVCLVAEGTVEETLYEHMRTGKKHPDLPAVKTMLGLA